MTRRLHEIAGAAFLLVLATWAVSAFTFAVQAVGCRYDGARLGVPVAYRLPGGCYAELPGAGWVSLVRDRD